MQREKEEKLQRKQDEFDQKTEELKVRNWNQ